MIRLITLNFYIYKVYIYIGDNSVIGAGSIVTKDIPSNVIAVGNPCRVLREINENDMKYYYRDMKIDIE